MFLGEDLMHSRDYSDVTSRVIDEEVERILREQEARASRLLGEHRDGPRRPWPAPCSRRRPSTGREVGRLVDEAYGRPVHEGHQEVPTFAEAQAQRPARPRGHARGGTSAVDHHPLDQLAGQGRPLSLADVGG